MTLRGRVDALERGAPVPVANVAELRQRFAARIDGLADRMAQSVLGVSVPVLGVSLDDLRGRIHARLVALGVRPPGEVA